jgi:hypothetical protein
MKGGNVLMAKHAFYKISEETRPMTPVYCLFSKAGPET